MTNPRTIVSLWGFPPIDHIRKWQKEWDTDPDAHCDVVCYVAAKAAEYGHRLGYQQCLAEFERAAMDIYPPPPDEDN
jgi:hypothetical protein